MNLINPLYKIFGRFASFGEHLARNADSTEDGGGRGREEGVYSCYP